MESKNYLDVHTYTLDDAKRLIQKAIDLSYNNGFPSLKVIHGFNNGDKIKTWCLKSGKNLKHVIKVDSGENEGITIFYIELKLF